MAGVVPRDLGADATDELDKARQRVQRVRDWRWREETEEDILGFKKKAPPPRDTLDLSRNMAEVLVKGKFTSVGDTAMGVHERRGAAAEDRAISGRRLLQALCKLVLLADVFMQLLLAAWLLAGQPPRKTTSSLVHPPYVLAPPAADVDWRSDPPVYRGYARAEDAPTYAERGLDTLELALADCDAASPLQHWGADDGAGAWQQPAGPNASAVAAAAAAYAAALGLAPGMAKIFPLASWDAATGAAACLGCGRSPFSCHVASLLTRVSPELRQCALRWPPPVTMPEGVFWRARLPAEGSDPAIRFAGDTSRCLSSSGIGVQSAVFSSACEADGAYLVADLLRPPRDGSAPRLSATPRCPRLSCPTAWSLANNPAPHQQWRWERLPADAAASPANLLRNGGFELPDVGHATKNVLLGETVAGWQHFGGRFIGIVFGTAYATPWGRQSIHLHGQCMRTQGGMRQRFAATPGAAYTLSFAVSGGAWTFGSDCATCASFAVDAGTVTVVDANSSAAALALAHPVRPIDAQNATLAALNFTAGGDILELRFGSTTDGVSVSTGAASWRRWQLNFTAPASGEVLLSFWSALGHCIQLDDVSVVGVAAAGAAGRARNATEAMRAQRRGLLRQYFAAHATGYDAVQPAVSAGKCLSLRPQVLPPMTKTVTVPGNRNVPVCTFAFLLLLFPHLLLALLLLRPVKQLIVDKKAPELLVSWFPFHRRRNRVCGLSVAYGGSSRKRVMPAAASAAPAPSEEAHAEDAAAAAAGSESAARATPGTTDDGDMDGAAAGGGGGGGGCGGGDGPQRVEDEEEQPQQPQQLQLQSEEEEEEAEDEEEAAAKTKKKAKRKNHVVECVDPSGLRFFFFCCVAGPPLLLLLDLRLALLNVRHFRGRKPKELFEGALGPARHVIVAHNRLRMITQSLVMGVPQVLFQLVLWKSVPPFTGHISHAARELGLLLSMLSVLLVAAHFVVETSVHGVRNVLLHAEQMVATSLGALPHLPAIADGSLKQAAFDGLEVSPEQLLELEAALQSGACALASLSLAKCDIGDAGIVTLARALRTNCTVTHLDLRGNGIGPRGKRLLEDALEFAQHEREVFGHGETAGFAPPRRAALSRAAHSGYAGVCYLSLDEWTVDPPEGVEGLGDMTIGQAAAMARASTLVLQEWDDDGGGGGGGGGGSSSGGGGAATVDGGSGAGSVFGASTAGPSTMAALDVDFSFRELAPEDGPLLARCLTHGIAKWLRSLNLSHNALGGRRRKLVDFDALVAGAGMHARGDQAPSRFVTGGPQRGAQQHKPAGYGDLLGDEVSYEADVTAVVALADVLRVCPSLTSLDLATAQLTGSADCAVHSVDGVVALAEALAKAPCLALVELSNNNLTAWNDMYGSDSRSDTTGLDAIVAAIAENKKLGLVVIRRNQLGFATQMKLRDLGCCRSGRLQL
jgi:hypothetical protein